MLSAVENLQGQPASPPEGALPAGSMEGTDKESGGCSNSAEGSLQDQESGGGEECLGVVSGAEGEEGTPVHPGMQRSRPFPYELPPTPPTSIFATTAAGAGAGAGAAAPGTRPGSLRPSVSGLLVGHSSGIFSRQREDRADSLGDRYKGTNAFRRQHQRHMATTSITRNAGYGAGERYGERSGTRRPSHHVGAAGRAGSSSTAKSGACVIGSLQVGAGGGGAERSTEREGRHGDGGGAGRRRARRVVDRGREWEATAKEEGLGEDGEERRKQNGRVAQIADGLIWVQKHPVLAAVIWMCGKVFDPGSEDKSKDAAAADATAAEGQSTPEESHGRQKGLGHQFSSGNSDGDSDAGAVDSMDPDMAGGPWRGPSGDLEKGRPVPPGFWRRHSKGRLSWSDDYQGGCLAEYYEDERSRMVSESSSVPPGDTGVSTSAEPAAATAAAAREEGGGARGSRADSCIVQSCRSQGGGSTTAAASLDPYAPKQPEKSSEPLGLSIGQDEDGEVFHSALQLADEDDDLEGLNGGCAALVRRDTFYGDVQEKMEDRSVRVSAVKRGSGGGAAASSLGGEPAKHEQSEGSGCRGGQEGEVAAGDTGVAAGSGGGTGTPTAGTSPGTWSPQWGWYVTMTPPQDQYPAQQFPIPGAKPPTPTASTAASEVPTSAKGRPPRP
ncbi:unnamed protein product [Ectocarpus sp. 4 AP-2014]